jgi:hypothetical protein
MAAQIPVSLARRHVSAGRLNASGDDTQRSYSLFRHGLLGRSIVFA